MPEPTAVLVTMGDTPDALLDVPGVRERLQPVDCYALADTVIRRARCVWLGMHLDQRALEGQSAMLTSYVERGGRVVVCGQIARPFLPGLSHFQPLTDYRVDDLVVHPVATHPVWHGVEADHLTYTRGIAGFYGRGWHVPPAGATVVNGLGAARRPVDFCYPYGEGEVLVHSGNDLWNGFAASDTTSRLLPQLLDWSTR